MCTYAYVRYVQKTHSKTTMMILYSIIFCLLFIFIRVIYLLIVLNRNHSSGCTKKRTGKVKTMIVLGSGGKNFPFYYRKYFVLAFLSPYKYTHDDAHTLIICHHHHRSPYQLKCIVCIYSNIVTIIFTRIPFHSYKYLNNRICLYVCVLT